MGWGIWNQTHWHLQSKSWILSGSGMNKDYKQLSVSWGEVRLWITFQKTAFWVLELHIKDCESESKPFFITGNEEMGSVDIFIYNAL